MHCRCSFFYSFDICTSHEDGPIRIETCSDNKTAVVSTDCLYILYLNHHSVPTYKILHKADKMKRAFYISTT
jgi:hypothetical protein